VEILGVLSEAELLQRRVAKLLSESLGMMGEKGEAMDILVRASEANPTDGELALDAAAACERAGDSARAINMAERASQSGDDKIKAAGAALLTRFRSGKP
jgi:Flp pilus assembly protein TadD